MGPDELVGATRCLSSESLVTGILTIDMKNASLVMDRDENSAVDIYERFLAGPPPHTP